MKTTLKRNFKINLLITLAISLLSFILNKYFSQYMGVDTLGLMRLFSQVIAYLNLADMGIGTATSYALYKPLMNRDIEKINIIISTIDYFYKKIALIILILGLLINLFLLNFIESNTYGSMLYIYWSLYVLNTSVSYIYAKYPILFTANQEFEKVRIIQGTGRIICQLIQLIFIIMTKSFLLFILIMLIENIYLYIFYKQHYKKYYNIRKVKLIDKKLIKNTRDLFWHKLSGVIVFNTDYIVISKYLSLKIIGIYSSYLMVYQIIMTLIGIISNVLTPYIGKYVAENNNEKIYEKWKSLYGIYFYISTFIVICTYYLITPFIKLLLGNEYTLQESTIILIIINLFIQMIRGITEIFKTASGFFDDIYAPILEGGLNLIFSIILVQKIGLNGVIIGTLISNIVVLLLIKPIMVFKRCFDKNGVDYIKILLKYLLLNSASIIFSGLCFKSIFNYSNFNSWINWILNAILIGCISLLITTLVFLVDNNFRSNFKIKKGKEKI